MITKFKLFEANDSNKDLKVGDIVVLNGYFHNNTGYRRIKDEFATAVKYFPKGDFFVIQVTDGYKINLHRGSDKMRKISKEEYDEITLNKQIRLDNILKNDPYQEELWEGLNEELWNPFQRKFDLTKLKNQLIETPLISK